MISERLKDGRSGTLARNDENGLNADSAGFMMPVGTPPNAIVFSTGRIPSGEMARRGLLLNILGVPILIVGTYLLIRPVMGIYRERRCTDHRDRPSFCFSGPPAANWRSISGSPQHQRKFSWHETQTLNPALMFPLAKTDKSEPWECVPSDRQVRYFDGSEFSTVILFLTSSSNVTTIAAA
jgi:hypothetical protein